MIGLVAGTVFFTQIDRNKVAGPTIERLARIEHERVAQLEEREARVAYAERPSTVVAVEKAGLSQRVEHFDDPQVYYVYYGVHGVDGKTRTAKQQQNLRFSKTSSTIEGEMSRDVSVDGKVIRRTWRLQGDRRDVEMVLGFATVATSTDLYPPRGIGTFYLAKANGYFTGT